MPGAGLRASTIRSVSATPLRSLLGVLLGVSAFLAGACGRGESWPELGGVPRPGPYEGPPILVVGMDGLEWSVLEPLLEQGRAPNFAALIRRGVAGALETEIPTWSPVVWTSIATGFPPEVHGIHFFSEADVRGVPKPGGLPYTSNCRKVPAFWNIAGALGRSVLGVAWWVSWPAEHVPGGRIVASYAAQVQGRLLWKAGVWTDGLPELTWPPELLDEIRPALQDGAPDGPLRAEYDRIFGTVPPEWRLDHHLDTNFRFVYHGDRTHLRIMQEQLRKEVADLNYVYLGLPDVAGHYFWRYYEPEAYSWRWPRERVERLHGRLETAYEVVDSWLGRLLEGVPEDTLVLVLSDHGMEAKRDSTARDLQSGAHERGNPGVLILAGPGVEPRGLLPAGDRRLGSIFDIAPFLLDLLGLPAGGDMPGQSLRRWMSADWRAAHPRPPAVQSYRTGWREATPPRVPAPDADQIFVENISELGYAGVGGQEPAPPSAGQGGG